MKIGEKINLENKKRKKEKKILKRREENITRPAHLDALHAWGAHFFDTPRPMRGIDCKISAAIGRMPKNLKVVP